MSETTLRWDLAPEAPWRLEVIEEQAALGVEGRLTVLKGAVDAPVRGRERAR